ncbi:tyrosine-type recombinase/integrase [Methylomonas koyamae]|uniref:tyrosine-type recombinase/integrase n=1 Tax=Methylomonas koyamae TaxID=702114 RepID=UPI0009E8C362|nr:site-specific integrase [Methylomonas koyamae]BBL56976.1 hypothetical protein MKFW12EY_05890 [Methylomonas koyamae]
MSNIVKFKHSPNYYARFKHKGRLYQKSTNTTSKKLAQQIADKYYEEVLAGLHNVNGENISIEDAIKGYASSKPLTSKNVQNAAKFMLKWLPNVIGLNEPISSLNNKVLENIIKVRRAEKLNESSISQTVSFITRIIKWAEKNGYNVAKIEPPKIKVKSGRLRYLSREEEIRLLAELDPNRVYRGEDNPINSFVQDNYDLTVLLLDTGARLSEITTLQWSQVNTKGDSISLYRSKVDNESLVYMTNRVKDILLRRFRERGNNKYVFTNSKGGHKTCTAGIRAALNRAGLEDCTIHTFRHTYASRCAQASMSLHEISSLLGHSNINTTTRYAHLCKSTVSQRARDLMNQSSSIQPTTSISPESYTHSYTPESVNLTEKPSYIDDLLNGPRPHSIKIS